MTRMLTLATLVLACIIGFSSTSIVNAENHDAASELEYLHSEIISIFPHDNTSFTQGLEIIDGELYESTGHFGNSTLRQVNLSTGEVIRQVNLSNDVFAEGITGFEGDIIQLTWKNNTAYVWNKTTFSLKTTFSYDGDGWGVCFDGTRLVMSSGTSQLTFRNSSTFEIEQVVNVTLSGEPIAFINELECHEGYVYANVWTSSRIMKINPQTGVIVANINASNLIGQGNITGNVLNGIAWDETNQGFLLTGKNWSSMYLVNFSKGDSATSPNSSIGPDGEGTIAGDGEGSEGAVGGVGGENSSKEGDTSFQFTSVRIGLLSILAVSALSLTYYFYSPKTGEKTE